MAPPPIKDPFKLNCEYCGVHISSNSNLHRHYRRVHQTEQSKRKTELACVRCDRGFTNAQLLKSHIVNCTGEFANAKRTKTSNHHSSDNNNNNNNNSNNNATASADVISSQTSSSPNNIDFETVAAAATNASNISNVFNFGFEFENSPIAAPNNNLSTALVPYADARDLFRLNVPMVQDETLDGLAAGFYQWLGQSAVSPLEQLVKHSKLITPQQLLPIKSNLKFLCNILLGNRIVKNELALRLAHFTRIDVISAIHDQLRRNNCKSERIYALFLLLKKLAIYLTTKQSIATSSYLLPVSVIPSYSLIETVANEHCMLRKRSTRDRLAGIQQQPLNIQSAVPAAAAPGENSNSINNNSNSSNQMFTNSSSSNTANTAKQQRQYEQIIPTKEDLSKLAVESIRFMNSIVTDPAFLKVKDTPVRYAQHLVMGILVLHPTPRTQVIANLNFGVSSTAAPPTSVDPLDPLPPQTLFKENGTYAVRMSSALSKDRQPVVFQLSSQLTSALDFYFQSIRPLLVTKDHADQGYVFVGPANKPKPNFTSWTTAITHTVLGKRITTHSFRHGMISMLYEHSENTSDTQMQKLASIMSHSHDVVRQFYFKISRRNESTQFNNEISSLLGISSTNTNAFFDPDLASSSNISRSKNGNNNQDNDELPQVELMVDS